MPYADPVSSGGAGNGGRAGPPLIGRPLLYLLAVAAGLVVLLKGLRTSSPAAPRTAAPAAAPEAAHLEAVTHGTTSSRR
ncbi:hypothetical protein GCM10010211_61040 [Streptomyces albospinus]|uniref:Uncharacterized protein n=1 Tax=Streptomyces albospinus TaxID=285515 RepID=A0ABQ2VH46_9ACTN|nr:hypothetical protein GCM10010211_61040 [Streptomyces albospinus]